ncbi:hypothetical protein DSM104299_03216 [Baekduia alba]|uniref:hypothetical protein n=1 Tax=Baekduia alba TaxID=2997333 RepID=UPI0023423438|nr:hypothetical protein [Baekduia alba]WCB94479.1 hypothetical protein DSM104299_03216 [Baekduia alba]
MSSSLLDTAMEQFYARMDSAAGPDKTPPPELSLLVLSGLDLDVDAARERMHQMAHAIDVTALLSGDPRCQVMADALVQVMAMGVLHERARVEQDRVVGP